MAKSNRHGLWTQEGHTGAHKVPLKEINVNIKILGFVAEVTSHLLYGNIEEKPIEAEFTFPVDDGSAVYRFEAEIEGRHIVAEIQEREQAKLTYKDATKKGYTALLLKEDDKAGDIFQCSLGNLPPKTDAQITFSYVIELPQEPDGRIRFTLPTVLNPRYSPDVGSTVAAEGATYMPPERIAYKFNMTAVIRGSQRVLSVTSTGDNLTVETNNDTSTTVTLAEEFKFDHDLSFLVEYENCYRPHALVERGNQEAAGIMKENVLMVNFYPELHESSMTNTGEYIFVIDRSGSMAGNRIKNAKEALFLFLKSLPAECYFNVVSFGSSHSFLFQSGSQKYTKDNLNQALALQDKMGADMGGTEIYQPFKEIFGKSLIKGHPRQIILLTDGEVSNTSQLIGLVKSHANNTRVFAVGIGNGVSTSLIKGVARAGNGKAEFISDSDRIQPKVVSVLKCATLPAMSNIELEWSLPSDVTAVPIPQQTPTFLTVGGRLCLYAILKEEKAQPTTQNGSVTLKGQCDGKPVHFKIKFPLASSVEEDKSAPLHRLAAKTQIKELETEEATLTESPSYSYSSGSVDTDSLNEKRQNIILLSTSANIVSKVTAFVAIDKDAGKQVEGEMVKRACPVPIATPEFNDAFKGIGCADFEGQERFRSLALNSRYRSCSQPLSYAAAPQPAACMGGGTSAQRHYATLDFQSVIQRGEHLDQLSSMSADLSKQSIRNYNPSKNISLPGIFSKVKNLFSFGWFSRSSTKQESNEDFSDAAHSPVRTGDSLLKVIDLQEIQGYWSMSMEVSKLIDITETDIASIKDIKDSDVVTTLAVIVWLRSKFSERHDEWEIIEKKSIIWLRSKLDKGQGMEDLLTSVENTLWPSGI